MLLPFWKGEKHDASSVPWKRGPWPPRRHRSRGPAAAAHSDTLERCCRSLGSPSGGSGPWCAYAHHQKVLLGKKRDGQKQTKSTNEEERKWTRYASSTQQDPNAGYWKIGLTLYVEILAWKRAFFGVFSKWVFFKIYPKEVSRPTFFSPSSDFFPPMICKNQSFSIWNKLATIMKGTQLKRVVTLFDCKGFWLYMRRTHSCCPQSQPSWESDTFRLKARSLKRPAVAFFFFFGYNDSIYCAGQSLHCQLHGSK